MLRLLGVEEARARRRLAAAAERRILTVVVEEQPTLEVEEAEGLPPIRVI